MTVRATPIRGYKALAPLLRFNEQGLIPAVIQEHKSKRVLTLCYLNRDAVERSLAEGLVYVFRRSLNKLMLKGETSGHIQRIRRVELDCDGKSLLFQVSQHVAGCHAGYLSCYYRGLKSGKLAVGERRVFDPQKVYRKH